MTPKVTYTQMQTLLLWGFLSTLFGTSFSKEGDKRLTKRDWKEDLKETWNKHFKDEWEKLGVECGFFKHKCPDGTCIDPDDICPDPGCTKWRPFTCGGTAPIECFRKTQKCDGWNICANGQDEANCPTKEPPVEEEVGFDALAQVLGVPLIVGTFIIVVSYSCSRRCKKHSDDEYHSPASLFGTGTTSTSCTGTPMHPTAMVYNTPNSTNVTTYAAEAGQSTGQATSIMMPNDVSESGGPPAYGAHEAYPLNKNQDQPDPFDAPPPSYDEVVAGNLPQKT